MQTMTYMDPTEAARLVELLDRADLADRADIAVGLEDTLESFGYLAAGDRRTCSTCRSWADHEHDIFNGARI